MLVGITGPVEKIIDWASAGMIPLDSDSCVDGVGACFGMSVELESITVVVEMLWACAEQPRANTRAARRQKRFTRVLYNRIPMKRTHNCGDLRRNDAGKQVTLCGWIHSRRDHGGVLFCDLRDRSGLVQILFKPEKAEVFQ